jgi:hypothetical protein
MKTWYMKTKIIFIIVALFTSTLINAQAFNKGERILNLTLGIGSTLYTGSGYSTSVPPLAISYEKGILDGVADKGVLGAGLYLGYTSSKFETSYLSGNYGWKYSNVIIGIRGALHYPIIDNNKLDTYAGLLLGYRIVSAKEIGSVPTGFGKASSSSLALSIFVGGRYFFNDKISGIIELGYGIAYLNLGVGIKL